MPIQQQWLNGRGKNLNTKRQSNIKKAQRQIKSQQKAAARANRRNKRGGQDG